MIGILTSRIIACQRPIEPLVVARDDGCLHERPIRREGISVGGPSDSPSLAWGVGRSRTRRCRDECVTDDMNLIGAIIFSRLEPGNDGLGHSGILTFVAK